MPIFGCVADDFTGANDTGVQLCKKDVAARVVLHASAVTSDVDSVVVDTESRVIAAEEAGRRVGAVAQQVMEVAAIGGKDSMSGTFENLTVPQTLVSFAIAPEHTNHIISPEFKAADDAVLLFDLPRDAEEMPDFDTFKAH